MDYKGGAAFRTARPFPHTLGLVTDLDEHLTARALASLGAELRRRERILAEAGAKDLDDYRAARRHARTCLGSPASSSSSTSSSCSRTSCPTSSTAWCGSRPTGRSWALHLVLATQRPGGIITGDMRANISLRICLRVRDRADSEDVIESPAAAQISDRTPGRALVVPPGVDWSRCRPPTPARRSR